MELYRRKDGRSPFWCYDAVDPITGKRVRKSTGETNIKAARVKAAAAVAAMSSVTRETTLGAALEAYVGKMRADGKVSWEDAQRKAHKLVGTGGKERWGDRYSLPSDLPLSKLTKTLLLEYRMARAAEGNKPGTLATEFRILRAACMLAADNGFNPPDVRKWDLPPPVRKLRYLTVADVEKLLEKLHPDTPVAAGTHRKKVVPRGATRRARQATHDLTLALVLTGGRWSEVAKMTWSGVNFTNRTVTLWGFKGSKERTVPMIQRLFDMLMLRRAMIPGEYVFPGMDGKARVGPTRAISRAMDACRFNTPAIVAQFGRATIHSLRHTYASWLRQKGLGLDEIQPLLGHADIATTQIYAKLVDADTLLRAREALEPGTPTRRRGHTAGTLPSEPSMSADTWSGNPADFLGEEECPVGIEPTTS